MKTLLLASLVVCTSGTAFAAEEIVRTSTTSPLYNATAWIEHDLDDAARKLGVEPWLDRIGQAGLTYGSPGRSSANSHKINKIVVQEVVVDKATGLIKLTVLPSYDNVTQGGPDRYGRHQLNVDPPSQRPQVRYAYIQDPQKKFYTQMPFDDAVKRLGKPNWANADFSFLPNEMRNNGGIITAIENTVAQSDVKAKPRGGRGKLGKAGKAAVIAVPAAAVGAVMMKSEAQAGAVHDSDLPNKNDVENGQQQDIEVLDAN